MAKRIAIEACNFVRAVEPGNKIHFRSKDGKAYTVTSPDQDVFDPIPLNVPANGVAVLKILSGADLGNYTLTLTCSKEDDAPRPTMIIKVE